MIMDPDPDKLDNSFEIISSHSDIEDISQNILHGDQSFMECAILISEPPVGEIGVDPEKWNALEISANNNFQDHGDGGADTSDGKTVHEIKENAEPSCALEAEDKLVKESGESMADKETVVKEITNPQLENSETISDVMVKISEDSPPDGFGLLFNHGSEDFERNNETSSATPLPSTSSDSLIDSISRNSQDLEHKKTHSMNKSFSTNDVNEENGKSHDHDVFFSGPKAMLKSVTSFLGLTNTKKSSEEKKNEKLMKTLNDTNVKLGELKSKVSSYEGPKSDKEFVKLKEEINIIRSDLIQLINSNNGKNIKIRFLEMIQESKNILDILNVRANDFEEKNSSDIINRIYEEIMDINNKVENSVLSIDALNLFEKTLMNFLLSLDNVDAKDRPAVKENYVATVRKLHDILKLVNEKSNNLSVETENKNPSSASSMEFGENVLTVEPVENNECDELIMNLDIIVKNEVSNAMTQYNKCLRDFGALEKYVKNLGVAHDRVKELCETQYLRITSQVSAIVEKHLKQFNQEINNDFKEFDEFNKTVARENLTRIQQKAYKVLSKEQKNILKFIDETKGQKELPSSFQTKIDEIFTSLDPYKDCNDDICRKIITEVKKFVTSITKNLKEKKAQNFINSLLEVYKFDTNIKEFGVVYNRNLAEELEKMKSTTLDTYNNIRKTSVSHDPYIYKLSQEIDDINSYLLKENTELWKIENEKYENYLKGAQENYKIKLFDEIISLGYLPEPEEINEIHNKILPRHFELLQTKCLNLNTIIDEQEIEHRFQLLTNKELEKIKENISLRKFNQRKSIMSERGQFAYAIGIDLGTTFSCVTVYKNGKFEELKNFQEFRTTPSVVYIGSDKPVVGDEALMKGMFDPSNLIHGIKRIIGRTYDEPEVKSFKSSSVCEIKKADDGGITICSTKNKHFKPEEIAAEILKELKHIAEHHIKNPVSDVVVTIPAFFNEPQRRATLEACKNAGLNVLRLLNEPTAAALAYGYHFQKEESANILVFDFGGGTCDVSILEVNGKNLNVKASYGNNYLGGLDFDNNLMTYLVEKLEIEEETAISEQNKRRILKECEKTKKILSDKHITRIYLAEIADDVELKEDISRDSFENINKELFDKALKTVEKCLESAGLRKHEIDDIVLAGGSSYIPKMQQMLREYFGKDKLECKINPDESISYGAALQAAIITGECKDDFQLRDITPFSLGINVVHDRYLIVIPKNSEIPCKGTETTCTVDDYQKAALFVVYQGENPVASHNAYLGHFTLNNITKRKAGKTSLLTTFEIDENGILTVTSVEEGKESNKMKITINRKVT